VPVLPMTAAHAEAVLAIYQAGLDGGQASFETTAPSWLDWDSSHLPEHRYVTVDRDGRVTGWAAVSPVSDRCVYGGVAEVSVYVHPDARSQGVGRALLDAVIASSERAGLWTLQAGVFPENEPSVRLHEAAGFRVVGRRERLGRHHGAWRDVLLLERRSPQIDAPAARTNALGGSTVQPWRSG
jgi:L-amino acid N-acyltransferase YncA